MEFDKKKIKTLDKTDERSPMDRANDRVEAEMKLIESEAKEQVAQGLQDDKLAEDAGRLRQEAEDELEKFQDSPNQ